MMDKRRVTAELKTQQAKANDLIENELGVELKKNRADRRREQRAGKRKNGNERGNHR